MSDHAFFPPSSAEQWANCAGAARAIAENPQPETPQSREGTAAHWVGSETLETGGDDCGVYLGKKAPNGVVIDEKMVDGAQVYVDDVLAVCDAHNARHLLRVEQRVHMPNIDPHGNNWGTFDASLFLRDKGLLFLWDYKHGFSEVQAVDNLQLADYAEGIVEAEGIDGLAMQHITLDARVVQPFAYRAGGPVVAWVATLSDLRVFWNLLATAIGKSYQNPTLSTGYHCRHCPAVGKCAATRKARYNFVEVIDHPYEMDEMDGHDLAVELDTLDKAVAVAKKRADAIRDELTHRVSEGDVGSGMTLETTQGREEWTAEPPVVVALASQFGVDARHAGLKTPNQVIAATPKELRGALGEVLKEFKRRKPGTLKLTRFADSKVARAFQTKREG